MFRLLCSAMIIFVITSVQATAQDVRITPELGVFETSINGKTIGISRIQDTANRLLNEFSKTSRPCPPFCIQPMTVAPGVATIGELEVLDFLKNEVATGRGLLVDARVPEWFTKGTIPGAVNIPFPTLEETNPFRNEILKAIGAKPDGDRWNFDNAMDLALFCNGPWCEQSPRAIKALLSIGYPASKLSHFRGGIQSWASLGLTLQESNS